MSDCESAPAIFIPDFGNMPQGVRFLLTVLERWADARGSIDATEEELAAFTGMGVSTVRRHMAWAAHEARAWVSRSERRRLANGQLSSYRYWLRLEKFGRTPDYRPERAVDAHHVNPPPDPPVTPLIRTGGGVSEPPPELRGSGAQLSGGEASKSSASGGVSHAGGRARPSVLSFPLSFAFRDGDQKCVMERILAVCGPGLCNPAECDGLTESLADVLDDWLARYDLEADIVPCIRKLTSYRRPKPVYDFRLFDRHGASDLQNHRDARLEREKRRTERSPRAVQSLALKGRSRSEAPTRSEASKLAGRIAGMRNVIVAIDRGERPRFVLSRDDQRFDGEALESAFIRVRDQTARDLADLEAEMLANLQDKGA